MDTTLHITGGDIAGDIIAKSGVPGEVFVWHDIHYDGPRKPGWPDEETLLARAQMIDCTHFQASLKSENLIKLERHQASSCPPRPVEIG